MKVESYQSPDVFGKLQSEWNNLLKRSITDTPFSSFEWHSNWWDAYHPGDLWILTVRDDAETLVGLASFFIVQDQGQRVLRFVGCEDVTDYLDLLIDHSQCEAVYEAIAHTLFERKQDFDRIDLCNIPADSPTRTTFSEAMNQYGFEVTITQQEVCPIIKLPGSFDAYLDALDKKQSKEIRRKLRIVEGLGDSVGWYTVRSEDNLDQEIERFLALMTASHPEKAHFLTDEQHTRFFKAMIPAAAKAGWLQLDFLHISGEPAAAYLNFDYNNRILVYNSGLDPDTAAALSPGIVLLAYTIEHAIQNGREEFDFLRGDESYKYRMGATETQIFNLQAKYAG